MHNLGLFVIQKNKKTMIKEKGKEICQRVLDTNLDTNLIDFQSVFSYNPIKNKTLLIVNLISVVIVKISEIPFYIKLLMGLSVAL